MRRLRISGSIWLLWLGLLPATRSGDATDAATGIWHRVKNEAQASGDRKALWKELKKLSPDELLVAGRQYCEAVERGEDAGAGEALIITTNAILSYHKERVGYEATAKAVGTIIGESDVAGWVYGCLEWIENNDHYRSIPPEGMSAIADGMTRALANLSRSKRILVTVVQKAASSDIMDSVPSADRERILTACALVAEKVQDAEVRDCARKTLNWNRERTRQVTAGPEAREREIQEFLRRERQSR